MSERKFVWVRLPPRGLMDKEEKKEYMREYMLNRYYETRKFCINKLGGKCVHCGSIENLEIDHIEPKLKLYEAHYFHSISAKKLIIELAKCQILCKICHLKKTVSEKPPFTHGTVYSAMKMKCKCKTCRDFYRGWKQQIRYKSLVTKKNPPINFKDLET